MLTLEILIVLLLTVLNGIFAMSELAVVSSRRARLKQMADAGSAGARTALRLIDDPGRFLSTVQIGITLIGIFAGAFGGATLADKLGDQLDTVPILAGNGDAIAIALVVIAITYLSLIVGELVPKRIALKNPERVASLVSRPMRLLSRVAAPVVWLLRASTDAILRLLRLHGEREATVTEEEVKTMISEGTQAGIFDPREKEMIEGVLRLADRPARSVMVPRQDVVWLDIDDDPETIRQEIKNSGYSRFLVCQGDIDEVVGVVRTRDMLDLAMQGQPVDLAKCMEEPVVVHEGTPVLKLLDLFKTTGIHMAVVVDEYGSLEGIVTVNDLMEVIAGDLPERGQETEEEAIRREDGSWLVEGMMPIDEFEDKAGLHNLKNGNGFHTVAGFVLHHLGHIPKAGECFIWNGARFEVVDMDGRRIDKVLVVPEGAAPDTDG
ncbi:MAG TPA: hemolysin family protein [Alphaproteobacteria bacterium]|nr:hemolysin family protein [Alphaproteobacteria bacterium]